MLNGRRPFVATAVVLFATVATEALSLLIEVKPADALAGKVHTGGFVFEITSARAVTGAVTFHVVITEAERTFEDQVLSVGLGRLVQRAEPDGVTISTLRTLSASRSGHAATCDFVVPADLVSDREIVFSFVNPVVQVVDRRREYMPAAHFYFARLNGFVRLCETPNCGPQNLPELW
jgi:hypothetical protein